jgi:hypothetical protein
MESRTSTYEQALKAQAEVMVSPIEDAIQVNATEIDDCRRGDKGVAPRFLCLLRLGLVPKELAKWCSAMLERTNTFPLHEDWKVFVQQLDVYPSNPAPYSGSHALVFCEYHDLGDPHLDSLVFEECLDAEKAKCIIYSVILT